MTTNQPWWRKSKVWYRLAATVTAVVLLCSAMISVNERYGYFPYLPTWHEIYAAAGFVQPSVPEDELHITVLNVGDADCILLQSGGEHVLIDTGDASNSAYILDAVYAAGVERLDYIIATHTDADHIGSMATIVREIGCDQVWMPMTDGADTLVYADLMSTLRQEDVVVIGATFGQTLTFGNASLTVISGKNGDLYGSSNDMSLVCRVTFGQHTFLFMGDVSAEVERTLLYSGIPLTADVIKVAHHGSNTSTDPVFITEVSPTYAVISCDSKSNKAHPHSDTIKTLEACGAQVYRTDIHGDIFIRSDGQQLFVTSEYEVE